MKNNPETRSVLIFQDECYVEFPCKENLLLNERLVPTHHAQEALLRIREQAGALSINEQVFEENGRGTCAGFDVFVLPATRRVYSTKGEAVVKFGGAESNHIMLGGDVNMRLARNELLILNGTCYHNGRLVHEERIRLMVGDSLLIGKLKIVFKRNGLECIGTEYRSKLKDFITPVDTIDMKEFPEYKRSPRIVKQVEKKEINFTAPREPERPKKGQLLKTLIPPLVMVVLTVATSFLMDGGIYVIVMAAGMVVTSVFTVTTYFSDKKESAEQEKARRKDYTAYLLNQRKELSSIREAEREARRFSSPDIATIEGLCHDYSSRIYERTSNDDDFLALSLGTAEINPAYSIKYSRDEISGSKDDLMKEMHDVADGFQTLPDMPLVVDLKKAHLGLVGEKDLIHTELNALISQICFFQSYHDIELLVLLDDEYVERFRWARWYPHTKLKPINVSGIVAGENHRDQVLGNLAQILKDRDMKSEEGKKEHLFLPHYVLIIDNPKLIVNHSVMEYLQRQDSRLGFSLIFTTNMRASLPENIKTILTLDGVGRGSLLLNEGVLTQTPIKTHDLTGIDLERMARKLTPLIHNMGMSTHIPEKVTFFELFGIKKPEELNAAQLWEKSNSAKSLAVPLGLRGTDDIVALNLHEKAHGPHGLVAGTTGSGKSEILQSYIISLAVFFHPYEVGFLLIDYKGGGMANLFRDLPHLLGTITNLDGSESMRALASIKSELARRQRIFGEHDVNNINQYTKLFKNHEAKIPLPHLFLISDEFAELKKEQPDFMQELVSAARIGRSLGVHLILATQKPSGVVDDQIWSNSKFKLALKVQDAADSNEVLKTPDAAQITIPGRAYLQVGNNEIYELFQSAWSGAEFSEEEVEQGFDGRIYRINNMGQRELLNEDLSEVEEKVESKLTQLDAVVEYLHDIYVGQDVPAVEKPWLPSLGHRIVSGHIRRGDVGGGGLEASETSGAATGTAGMSAAEAADATVVPTALETSGAGTGAMVVPTAPEISGAPGISGTGTGATVVPTVSAAEFQSVAPIGIVDIPEEQKQVEYVHDFLEDGNFAIFGASGFGKSTVEMNLALTLASTNSPEALHYYILDLGNSSLVQLKELPHTADYLTYDQEEKISKLVKLFNAEISRRKQLFARESAINFKMYNQVVTEKLPAIVLFVDNYDVVREIPLELEEFFVKLTRDGTGIGIYTVVSASAINMVRYAVLNNFKNKISLFMFDPTEIVSIVGRSQYTLPEVKGRAMVNIGSVSIMQCYLPADAENDVAYAREIGRTVENIGAGYGGGRPKPIPMLPETVTLKDIQREEGVSADMIPIGLDSEDVRVQYLSLRESRHLIIGKPKTGKSNVLKIILSGITAGHIFVADSPSCALRDFAGRENTTYAMESADTDAFYEKLEQVVEARREQYMESDTDMRPGEFYGTLPPLVLVIDNGDQFVHLFEEKESELGMLLPTFFETGGSAFVATVPNGLRGYDEVTGALKEALAGLVLGNPNDQSTFDLYMRNVKAEIEIGYICGGGDPVKVKIPEVLG